MNATYCIKMDNGRIYFRTKETDAQVNMKPVSNEIVEMVKSGEVSGMDVVNAIGAKLRDDPDFDFNDYNNKLRLLNVRKANRQETPNHEELEDRSVEEISVAEVRLNMEKGEKSTKEVKREKMKKISSELDDIMKI